MLKGGLSICGDCFPQILFQSYKISYSLTVVSIYDIIHNMNGKHWETLDAIFENPVRSNLRWAEIEVLFVALGGTISEGRGSRIRVAIGRVKAIFHRPHPHDQTGKSAVKSVRKFLKEAGIEPKWNIKVT